MKKSIILLLIVVIFIAGCTNKEKDKVPVKKKEKKEEVVEKYKDLNTTPIGLYQLQGNKLTRLDTITKTLKVEEDIGIFQIYFSNDKEVNLDKSFADKYYEEYNKYNVKVGFNIKYTLNTGEEVSYNILNPSQAFEKWEYLMNYLYDDFANKGKGFYSHIENNEYTESTLFTSIKLQSSYKCQDISKLELKVFTYDDLEDIYNNDYRGNSQHTMKICLTGKEC